MFKTKKKGFTLMELIIVMALTLVILAMVFQMFNTNNRIMSDVDIKSTLQSEGQVVQETLSKIGMQANSITPDKEGSVDSINFEVLNEDESKSEFEIKKQNKELSITEYRVTIDEGVEEDKSKVGNERLLTSNLKELNISSNDKKSAQIKIILSKEKGYTDIEYPLSIKFSFRNKEIKY